MIKRIWCEIKRDIPSLIFRLLMIGGMVFPVYMTLMLFGIMPQDTPIWTDIIIVCLLNAIYDFVFWYFNIIIYITFSGNIRYTIRGGFQR